MRNATGLGAWYDDWLYSITGRVSPDQKQAQVTQCVADQIKASGGTMRPADAGAICTQTISAVLTADSADPSQSFFSSMALPAWAPIAGAALAGLLVVSILFKRR